MADRLFTHANLIASTHVTITFHIGQSRSGSTDMSVTIPADNAHALAARLLEILSEYSNSGRQLHPLPLGNGQQIVFGHVPRS